MKGRLFHLRKSAGYDLIIFMCERSLTDLNNTDSQEIQPDWVLFEYDTLNGVVNGIKWPSDGQIVTEQSKYGRLILYFINLYNFLVRHSAV